MRPRPHARAGVQTALAVVLLVACTAPVPGNPTPAPGQSQGPVTSPETIGEEPFGGTANQPPPQDWSPTPTDKILADVEAGKIDADTGLMYRIFASFADPRLPAEYAGGAPDIDQAALDETAFRQANGDLPQAVADAIRPYLLRPTNPESAFYGSPTSGVHDQGIVPAAFFAQDQPACGANGWATLRSDTQPVKVWVRCDDVRLAGLLRDALEAAETLYSEESDAEMMGPAILDTGALLTDEGKDAGGDNAIDIYFTQKLVCINRAKDCRTLAGLGAAGLAFGALPFSSSTGAYTSSAYVVLDRAYGDSRTDIWALIAHELFHVLQDAHNVGGRVEGGKSHWFTEASATWAQQYFVPDARAVWTYPQFAKFQTASVGLTSTPSNNAYVSFVWPYFMEQKAKWTSIGDAWRAIEGQVGWEAINAAMAGVLSFEKNYKDFAVQAFNYRLNPGDPASPEMQVPDAKFPTYVPELALSRTDDKKQVTLGRVGLDAVTVPVKVPALAMRYHVFGVADNVKKLEVDFTGVQPSQAMDVEALLHIEKKGWERRALSDGKTTFCRDRPADNVDGAILVIANHSWADAEALTGSYKLQPSDKPCEENKDLHLGGVISWNATASEANTSPPLTQSTSGQADVVIHVVTHSLLVAERDDHSTYKYEYSSNDEQCPSSLESGTLESGGGVGEVQQTDYSIGMLNVGGRLGEDLYLSINIPDYCGPSMGGDVSGDYYGFQGFPHCALNSQTIARFDGKENYVIDCDVVEWAGYTNDNGGIVSGHISGTLHILDGPHPTPPY